MVLEPKSSSLLVKIRFLGFIKPTSEPKRRYFIFKPVSFWSERVSLYSGIHL